MTIENRTVTIKNVFAGNANTTIPTPPAVGVSYRNESTTAAEIGEGWPYKEIVDSAKFNQAMYEYTTICQQLEKYGFLPWSANTDYPAQGCALGSDGNVYQAKQATGPSTTAMDPVHDTNHTYWDLFYYSSFTANRAIVSNASGKLTASSITDTQLGYLSGATSNIQTQINAKAADNTVVHLAGTETITGDKTFQNQTFQQSTTSTSAGTYVDFVQSINGARRGTIRTRYNNDGSYEIVLGSNGTDALAPEGITVKRSGSTIATSAPASDANNSIVTTVAKSKGANGYFKLGNGMIVQYGRSSTRTITYPIPFSTDTSFSIVVNNQAGTDGYGRPDSVSNLTRTSCMVGDLSGYPVRWLAIGY